MGNANTHVFMIYSQHAKGMIVNDENMNHNNNIMSDSSSLSSSTASELMPDMAAGLSSSSSSSHPHNRFYINQHYSNNEYYSNLTLQTSVSIRVTPIDDYFVSWGILWGLFLFFSLIALTQVCMERKILQSSNNNSNNNNGASDVENNGSTDTETRSTADVARCIFRRLILLAMVLRVIMMPVQIWADPMWWQFVGDTLPEMVFASAWSLMVTFFVQLVGVAEGVGTNTSPGVVISATAYAVYVLLICLQLFNNVASVLLYALLCCIYAALFGIVLYFCPRLLSLLKPTQQRHGGLFLRLAVCTFLCLFLFGNLAFGFARRVVAPPRKVYWWINYGMLELLPSATMLLLMHPQQKRSSSSNTTAATTSKRPSPSSSANSQLRKQHYGGSGNSGSRGRLKEESTALLKGSANYGATDNSGGEPV